MAGVSEEAQRPARDLSWDRDVGVPLARDLPSRRAYRYRSFDATELRLLLAAHQIRFANATYFNDPWDCRPRIELENPRDAQDQERIIQEIVQLATRTLPAMDPAIHQKNAQVFRGEPQRLQKFIDEQMGGLISGMRAKHPVLCLATRGDAPLDVRSHYANAHRGLCLVFNTQAQTIGNALQVRYVDEYPVIVFPRDLGQAMVKTVLTKAAYWKHEEEYRIVAQETEPGDSDWQPRSERGFVTLEQDALVGVILGAFMVPNERTWARSLIESTGRDLEVWHAHLQEGQYALRVERMA